MPTNHFMPTTLKHGYAKLVEVPVPGMYWVRVWHGHAHVQYIASVCPIFSFVFQLGTRKWVWHRYV